ncbi:right-handed parallel beta-helix repeat-containing protein [Chryseobacterium sp.]|jgi:hypothetical protein|uniref:right-handed parallel beta-helix repeat-containing protein n=1 Tax=Chryseobacterium sp. TaxID=1871047 RepID=UPI0028980787|nr:right-handed parallel beta-helix repeat-containing protein [Chryseobacterium sp.]
MTNCNSQRFPSTCTSTDYGFKKFFAHTGEEVYYQNITGTNLPEDGIVIILENGEYYKAILNENTINIEWYRCDKEHRYNNDEEIILAAVKMAAYLGATLRFDAREYIVNNQLSFQGLSCFKLLGDKQHTLIKPSTKDRVEGFYFNFNDCHNVIIDGLRFDQNQRNLIIYSAADDVALKEFNCGIYFTLSSCIEITNCSFYDLYNHAIRIYSCGEGNIIVSNNHFESGLQKQIYVMEHLVVSQAPKAKVFIENNIFENAENHDPSTGVVGIFAYELGEGGSVIVNNNHFEYCGRNHTGKHRLYAIDFYENVNNFEITNNVIKNCTWGAIRFDGTRKNGIITNNIIHQLIADEDGMIMTASREDPKFNQTEFKNIIISNNILESSNDLSYGITIQGLSPFCAAENIEISHNKMYDLRYGIKVNGDVSVMSINNNQAINLIGIGIEMDGFKTGYDHTPLVPNNIEKIYINDNHLNGRKEPEYSGFVGVQINGIVGVHDFMGRVLINNNFISGNNKGKGITTNVISAPANSVSSIDNRIAILGNEIDNVEYGLFLRCHENFVKDNIFYNCVQPFLEDYTDNIKVSNYHNNLPV